MDKKEVKKESEKQSQENRNVSVRKVDGIVIASYSSYSNDEWLSYEKTFKTIKEFSDYTDKFLDL